MALPTKIIVTGAAQGIGRAVALRLASSGAHIAVWDVLKDAVEETANPVADGNGLVTIADDATATTIRLTDKFGNVATIPIP